MRMISVFMTGLGLSSEQYIWLQGTPCAPLFWFKTNLAANDAKDAKDAKDANIIAIFVLPFLRLLRVLRLKPVLS